MSPIQFFSGDQGIREYPASRGTETSAEVLVCLPGRILLVLPAEFFLNCSWHTCEHLGSVLHGKRRHSWQGTRLSWRVLQGLREVRYRGSHGRRRPPRLAFTLGRLLSLSPTSLAALEAHGAPNLRYRRAGAAGGGETSGLSTR